MNASYVLVRCEIQFGKQRCKFVFESLYTLSLLERHEANEIIENLCAAVNF